VLVETKFSAILAKDQQLGATEVNQKMAYCARSLEGSSGTYSLMTYDKVYVIFMDMRNIVTQSLLDRPLFLDGTTAIPSSLDRTQHYCPRDDRLVGIVLNREKLEKLIGDTLFYRAELSLDSTLVREDSA